MIAERPLMKIHNIQQGSAEWLKLRLGIPTASEFGNLVTPSWKIRTGEMPASYLATKLAERWLGTVPHSWSGGVMEQGQIREEEAVPWYELEYDTTLSRPGFITAWDGRIGCSPDALIVDSRGEIECGLEIKCPEAKTHTKWLLAGGIPDEHKAQVYGSMLVTGLERWNFLSYCRGFPALLVTATWGDEEAEAFDNLNKALRNFLERFAAGIDKLTRLNGGVQ